MTNSSDTTKTLLTTPRFTVKSLCHRTSNESKKFYYIEKADAVATVAVSEENVLLIQQYRPILGLYSLELPGGRVEAEESPEVAAKRELLEETGFQADHVEFKMTLTPLPSLATEQLHIFLAREVRYRHAPTEIDTAEAQISMYHLADLTTVLHNGTIHSAADAFALSMLPSWLSSL